MNSVRRWVQAAVPLLNDGHRRSLWLRLRRPPWWQLRGSWVDAPASVDPRSSRFVGSDAPTSGRSRIGSAGQRHLAGALGGSRAWQVVLAVVVLARLVRAVSRPRPVALTERLDVGEALEVRHLPAFDGTGLKDGLGPSTGVKTAEAD